MKMLVATHTPALSARIDMAARRGTPGLLQFGTESIGAEVLFLAGSPIGIARFCGDISQHPPIAMKRFILFFCFSLALTGCGSDVHDMKISEFYKLSPEERKEFARKLTADEMKYLFRGSSAFLGDSAGFPEQTVGDVIEEGRRMVEEQEKRK